MVEQRGDVTLGAEGKSSNVENVTKVAITYLAIIGRITLKFCK